MTTATENAVVSKNVCQQIRQKIISWTRLRDALEALLKQNPQDAADIEARIQQANDAIDELNGDWVDAGCRGAPLQTLAASGTSARISMDDLAESVASGVLRAIESRVDLNSQLDSGRSVLVAPWITCGGRFWLTNAAAIAEQAAVGQ